MRSGRAVVVLLVLSGAVASAQEPAADAASWSASASVYTYVLPGEGNYAQTTFAADHGPMHLEVRHNYEGLGAGSLWAGYTFEGGSGVTWSFTPMMGRVFGDLQGFGPGFSASLGWWKFDIYSESEYVVDVVETSDSFFYNWSEVSLLPVEWLRVGLVTQRTRAWASDRDVQRGPLVGVSAGRMNLTAYALNADDGAATVIVSLGVNFGSD